MKTQSFLEYLQMKHGEKYEGFDDDMPDAFEEWLEEQNQYDLVEYAEMWKALLIKNKQI